MRVTFKSGFFVVENFKSIENLKRLGFITHPVTREVVTKDFTKAARLVQFFDDKAKRVFDSYSVKKFQPPGEPWFSVLKPQLDDYQKDAVKFALSRNHSYLALEQGLGKTVISIAIQNLEQRRFKFLKTLIIVPNFLVSNWLREFEKFSIDPQKPYPIRASKEIEKIKVQPTVVISDTLLIQSKVFNALMLEDFDLIIVDEADRFNSVDAKRTKALFTALGGIVSKSKRVVLLSGTPMRNSPIDLYPSTSRLAWAQIDFLNYYRFAFKYCDAKMVQVSRSKKVLDVSGASNVEMLKEKTKDFFFIKRVKDVESLKFNTEENLILLDSEHNKSISALEKSVLKSYSISDLIGSSELGQIAKYRKEVSKLKVDPSIAFIEDLLKDPETSILVFGVHRELLSGLHDHFFKIGSALIYGGVTTKERDEIEQKFQSDEIRIIFANIKTMVGLNLTKANKYVFVESSWTPAANDQAKKRTIRRGQNRSVIGYHLALANTLDEVVLRKVLKKEEVVNTFIDTPKIKSTRKKNILNTKQGRKKK